MANVVLLTGLDDVYIHRPAFTAAAASMVAPAAQPSSPHGHANSAAIVSDSDCDSDLDYNPAAVESEVSSTDDDEEPSVDIMFGARKSWADMDPKSRARAVRKLLPHMKETLLTQLHPNIHSEAGDIMTAIGQAMSTKKRRRKQRRQSGALRMPSNSDRKTAEERAADPVVTASSKVRKEQVRQQDIEASKQLSAGQLDSNELKSLARNSGPSGEQIKSAGNAATVQPQSGWHSRINHFRTGRYWVFYCHPMSMKECR